MDYIDWCGRVLSRLSEMCESSPRNRKMGVHDRELSLALSQELPEDYLPASEVQHALFDMRALGLVEDDHGLLWKLTRPGAAYLVDPLPVWRYVCSTPLKADQEQILRMINRLCQREHHGLVHLQQFDQNVFMSEVPVEFDLNFLDVVAEELGQLGFINFSGFLSRHFTAAPTLRGLIWETRQDRVNSSVLVNTLVEGWEDTNTEFKRQVILNSQSQKAEFVKDIIGLANTQTSGKRRLIIGFDDSTRGYGGPPDPAIDPNQLEQILSHYTEPVVQITYRVVDHLDGVGMIEVHRDPAHVPYRVADSVGEKKKVQAGQVFVRHGSLTEEPTPRELETLIEEGHRARSGSASLHTQIPRNS